MSLHSFGLGAQGVVLPKLIEVRLKKQAKPTFYQVLEAC